MRIHSGTLLVSLAEETVLAAGVEITGGATARKDDMALSDADVVGGEGARTGTAVLAGVADRDFHALLLNNGGALRDG